MNNHGIDRSFDRNGLRKTLHTRIVLWMLFGMAVALGISCALPALRTASSDAKPTRPPNILLVLVDDMGYSDIGCYGGEIRTPTLDRLAANGVRLARFYNGAQCCPTRAALLTGLYPHQAGMGDMNARGPDDPFWSRIGAPSYLGFRKDVPTLAEALRAAGYQTFMAGKWHLGDTPDNWPSVRGFERTFSLVIGASEHFTGYYAWRNQGPIAPFILDGQKLDTLPPNFYSTDTFTDYALQFIREADPQRPWFGYVAYTAPHWPIQAHAADIARYADVYKVGPGVIRQQRVERLRALGLWPAEAALPELDPEITEEARTAKTAEWELWMRTYAAMIDRVDQNIARLVGLLQERGELDNTLLLFLSDNGADEVRGPLWGQVSNTPFRRFKVWTHEGGIATPLIVHWPAGIPATQRGQILPGYGHVIDIQPTCLDAANAPLTRTEGISLLPALRGESPLPSDRFLFWERMGNEAVRRGDWKLVRGYGPPQANGGAAGQGPRTGAWELYNLAVDPGETRNLAATHPGLVAELRAAYEEWARRVGVLPRERILEIAEQIKTTEK